jgi:hypothetical protein
MFKFLIWTSEVLRQSTPNTSQFTFIDFFTWFWLVLTPAALQWTLGVLRRSHAPTVVGVALGSIGWRLKQLFNHVNTRGFLLLPLKSGQCDTSRNVVTSRTIFAWTGNQTATYIPVFNIPVGEHCLFMSHWSESEEYKLDIDQRQLES